MRFSPHLKRGGEPLSHQVKADVVPIERLGPRPKRQRRLERSEGLSRSGELQRSTELARTELGRTSKPLRSVPVSPATDEQKAKVEGLACIASVDPGAGPCWGPIDPMHLIDRSMAPSAGDDIRAVVPGCRRHHVAYDDGDLDLTAYLEPRWRTEEAWAVEAVGLLKALRRISGKHWRPVEERV